jgi:hypothetical protein
LAGFVSTEKNAACGTKAYVLEVALRSPDLIVRRPGAAGSARSSIGFTWHLDPSPAALEGQASSAVRDRTRDRIARGGSVSIRAGAFSSRGGIIMRNSVVSLARAVALASVLGGAAAWAQKDPYEGTTGPDERGNPHAIDMRDRQPPGASSPSERKSLEQGEEEAPASVLNRDAPKPKRITNDELDRAEVGNPDVDSARE